MAEIKIDFMNYYSVNQSNPNICNSPKLQKSNSGQQICEKFSSKKLSESFYLNLMEAKENEVLCQNATLSQLSKKFCSSSLSTKDNLINDTNLDEIVILKSENEDINGLQDEKNFNKNYFNNGEIKKNKPVSATTFVTSDDIKSLLEKFNKGSFKTNDYGPKEQKIQLTCLSLFNCDYLIEDLIIINNEGELSSTYPVKIIIPKTKAFPISGEKLKILMNKARIARCRCRFPIPVILYNEKYICRSATLSGGVEIYSRQGYDFIFNTVEEEKSEEITEEFDQENLKLCKNLFKKNQNNDVSHHDLTKLQNPDETKNQTQNTSKTSYFCSQSYFPSFKPDSSQVVNQARKQDISLLNYLHVKQIVDLMVEKKKVKFRMNVTSSEKADKLKRYRDFNIMALPYPGCEFFKDYRNNNYQAEGLKFDWTQNFVDADLFIPNNKIVKDLNIDYNQYKKWDIIILTQNYLKLILSYHINSPNESMLIHCISGWDRTPLFISLIRLSLWADYKIHCNLNYEQITYLTLGYDWYLFGHNLNDRINKGEEIMYFCFYFLKYISSMEFSIDYLNGDVIKVGDCYERINFICCKICSESTLKNLNDEDNLKICNETEEDLNTSMYSSIASTIVNNYSKSKQRSNGDGFDKLNINCKHDKNLKIKKNENLTNDKENFETKPSSSFIFKNLNPINNTDDNIFNNCVIDNTDLNVYDVISLDDQSLSSNSSFDVVNFNKHQTLSTTSYNNKYSILNKQKSLRKNTFFDNSTSFNLITTEDTNNSNEYLFQHTINNTFTLDEEDEDILNISGESNVEDLNILNKATQRNNIQRSNAVEIPNSSNNKKRNRQNKSTITVDNEDKNWSSELSNNSNNSNKLSDNSFNLNRCDSWQLVTDTGSIRDKNFLSNLEEIRKISDRKNQHIHNKIYKATCCCNKIDCGKHCELIYSNSKEKNFETKTYNRSKRLFDVRALFYSCYSKTIGLSTPANSNELLSTKPFQDLFHTFETMNPFSTRNTSTASNMQRNFFNKDILSISPSEHSSDKKLIHNNRNLDDLT